MTSLSARAARSSPPGVGRPRAPGTALGVAALALVVLVGSVALTARDVPPPTVAEFAPQAVRQITESQPGLQGPGVGGGGGGRGPDVNDGGDDKIVETERVRRCIGNPPRQTEDPQSPPCVAFFEGDNGGATWRKGVTGTTIRVAVANHLRAHGETEVDSAAFDRGIEIYERYFNRRFMFYGRQLDLIPYTPARNAASASQMQTDAVRLDQMDVFAAAHYSEQDGRQNVFFDALAEREIVGIISAPGGITRNSEADLRAHAPYQWQYLPTADRYFAAYGDFLCRRLAGHPPRYAGEGTRDAPRRVFGVVVDISFPDAPPYDIAPLRSALEACGETLVEVAWDTYGAPINQILELTKKGVTSVLYTGQGGIMATRLMPTAAAQGYNPEWLVWTLGYQDLDALAGYFPKTQLPQVIGLSAYNKSLRAADMPRVWAAREVDPSFPATQIHYELLYKTLLLLASGIQMAGPELTPKTFEAGLMRARFPNPGAGNAPYYQAAAGFPAVHSMQQDLTMIWASGSERSPTEEVPPAYCYAERGRRYPKGGWPSTEARFFDGACR